MTFSKGQKWKQNLSGSEFSFLHIWNNVRKSSVYLQTPQIYLSSLRTLSVVPVVLFILNMNLTSF